MKPTSAASCAVTILAPVYQSAEILPLLVDQIEVEMTKLDLMDNFELLLVNDASKDHSWEVISALSQSKPFLKGISLRRNFGQHNATIAGLNYAKGEIVIVIDDDLQHPPKAIGAMLEALKRDYDVCYTRYLNRQHSAWKKFGSQFNNWIATALLRKPKELYLSSYKAIRKEIVNEIIKYNGPYPYIDGLILDITRSITSIDIEHQARAVGAGNYNLRKSFVLWMQMATSFSVFPLRIASITGFLLAGLSLVTIIIVIVNKLLHPEIAAGWASLIATILFIGGIQTLCIGVLGEYLGRAYLKLNNKPQFSVGRTTWESSIND